MAYEGKCGSCANFEEAKGNQLYDTGNSCYVKGFCTWYRSYYYPDDSCVSHYKSRPSSSNCYITTLVCNRLGKEDNCEELETLRKFRNDVLQEDEKYASILFEYDTVGPQIAKELCTEDQTIINKIFNTKRLKILIGK